MATVNATKVCDCGKPKLEKFPTCKDCKNATTVGGAAPTKSDVKLGISCDVEKGATVGEYQVNYIVLLTKGGKNLSGKDVEVIFSGKVISTTKTNFSGRVTGNFKITAKPDQEFEVVFNVLDAETITDKCTIKTPPGPPKPSTPIDFDNPRKRGEKGKYHLDMQLLFDGPPRAVVVIVSESLKYGWTTILSGGESYRTMTSPTGFLPIPLTPAGFTEGQRKIIVQVDGTKIDREVFLDGPDMQFKADENESLWENLKRLFKTMREHS